LINYKKKYIKQKMDTSLRFFHFVSKFPGIASYLEPRSRDFVVRKQVFQFKCLDEEQYKGVVAEQKKQGFDVHLKSDTTGRKLVPPVYTKTQKLRLNALLHDTNINYIIFPCLWQQYYPASCKNKKAADGKPRMEHMVLFALNKARGVIELWDDTYARSQLPLDYDDTVVMIEPYLEAYFHNMKVPHCDALHVPMLPRETIFRIQEVIKETNFHAAYTSFLANYIRRRSEESTKLRVQVRGMMETDAQAILKKKTKSVAKMSQAIPLRLTRSLNKYLVAYDRLKTHNATFTHFDANKAVFYNPNVPIQACKEDEYYDVLVDKCKPTPSKITLPMGEYKKARVRKDLILEYYYYVCLYFHKKYPYLSLMVPNNIQGPSDYYYAITYKYIKEKEDQGLNPFVLHTPPNWNRFLKASLKNPNIRFVVILFGIRGRNDTDHANFFIIDKNDKTIHRYEPNTGGIYPSWGNKAQTDIDLQEFFKNEAILKGYKYHGEKETCPYGLQRVEWQEYGINIVQGTTGNCALWTLFMLDLRLANPDVSIDVLSHYALQQIRNSGSFKHFIDAWGEHILSIGKEERKKKILLRNNKAVVTQAA
jgi:hypothetical protein